MNLKTLIGAGLALTLGFSACAQADTEAELSATVAYSLADVVAAPEAWREADPENIVILETTKGQIVIEVLPEIAPVNAAHFTSYVRNGLYDDTPFHRVIDGFMAQGGDVEDRHGAEKLLESAPAEFTIRRDLSTLPIDPIGPPDAAIAGFHKGFPIETQAQFMADPMWSSDGMIETWMPHCPGVLSTARLGEGPGVTRTMAENSGNAQFFLISDQARHLDKAYTAKGRVIKGLDVVKAIKLGPTPNGFPIANPDIVKTATLLADLPEIDRPKVFVQRTDTDAWGAILADAAAAKTDVCAIPQPVAVVE